ncbi:unnamed protein product [Allacma fusca]|uniref:Uncharacterized protein n=1 Tax=Allacma fusca TaxID=39272 RepID=A0A8J2JMH7_9HEXA|nr:unnamed protein product [Allacma fusca]
MRLYAVEVIWILEESNAEGEGEGEYFDETLFHAVCDAHPVLIDFGEEEKLRARELGGGMDDTWREKARFPEVNEPPALPPRVPPSPSPRPTANPKNVVLPSQPPSLHYTEIFQISLLLSGLVLSLS